MWDELLPMVRPIESEELTMFLEKFRKIDDLSPQFVTHFLQSNIPLSQ